MCEQKYEQEQNPPTPGKKILWIVGPEDAMHISKDLPGMLNLAGVHSGRVVYNNMRSCDETPEWERTSCNTPEGIFSRIKELQSGDCYILDNLELVCCPGKMDFNSELLSFGEKLFRLASSRGVCCLIVALRRSWKEMEELQLSSLTPYQYKIIRHTDIFFENDYGRLCS